MTNLIPTAAEAAGFTRLKEALERMGVVVDGMIGDALRSVSDGDAMLARSVARHDFASHERNVDEISLTILGMQRPAAGELRRIALAIKTVTTLSRAGDLASKIAERSEDLANAPRGPAGAPRDLMLLGELARAMLRDVVQAYVELEPALAAEVRDRDERVGPLLAKISDEIRASMLADPANLSTGIAILFLANLVERIARLATALAENLLFRMESAGGDGSGPRRVRVRTAR